MKDNSRREEDLVSREREWQEQIGGRLQAETMERLGTRLVLNCQYTRIANALGISDGALVLDIGCGTGHLLRWLKDNRSVRGVGIDLALGTLFRGQEAGLNNLLYGDAQYLPLKSSSVECIVCKGSVHHMPDLTLAIKEMYRVLSPGGKLVLFEPMATLLTNFLRRIFAKSTNMNHRWIWL